MARVDEVDLIRPDLFRAQIGGRAAEVSRKLGDVFHVGALGVRREIADAHVLEHALAKRSHGTLLGGAARSIRAVAGERTEKSASPC